MNDCFSVLEYFKSKNQKLYDFSRNVDEKDFETARVISNVCRDLEEHMKVAKGDLSDEEVEKAKELLKGRYLLSLEDSMNIAAMYGAKYILEGEIVDTQKTLEKLKKIGKKEVIAVAQDIFREERLTCAIIGPLQKGDITLQLKSRPEGEGGAALTYEVGEILQPS